MKPILTLALCTFLAGQISFSQSVMEEKIAGDTFAGDTLSVSSPDFQPCNSPSTNLGCGSTLANENNLASQGWASNFSASSYSACGVGGGALYGAPDRLYKITIATETSINIVMQILTSGKDLDMFLLSQCTPTVICMSASIGSTSYESIQYTLQPGVYYLVVDGYAGIPINGQASYNLTMTCTGCGCTENENVGNLMACDDFQAYALGGVDNQSGRWNRWSSGSGDVNVESSFGNKYAHFNQAGTNMLYGLDLKSSGRYRLSWRMFVAAGKKGYYKLLHRLPDYASGNFSENAYEVYFDGAGTGRLIIQNGAGGFTTVNFTYPQNLWFNVVNIIDLDAGTPHSALFINYNFVRIWDYALDNETGTDTRMHGLNFNVPDASYDFKIDDICYRAKITGCSGGPTNSPVCLFTGEEVLNAATAMCNLFTSAEWEVCRSLCGSGGTFIHRGDEYAGQLDVNDLAPSKIRTDPCIISAYGGSPPLPLYADVYIFYKNDNQTVNVSFDNMGQSQTKKFVFACNTIGGGGACVAGQKCLSETFSGSGVYTPAPCDNFYYIVVTSTVLGATYTLSVTPLGPCGSSFQTIDIPCNLATANFDAFTISGPVVGSLNDASTFNASANGAYEQCYNGNRPYTGGEKIYKFVLDHPVKLSLRLGSSAPVGMFLYSFLCGSQCINYAENNSIEDSTVLNTILTEGTYFLIIDKGTPTGGSIPFTLNLACQPLSFFTISDAVCVDGPFGQKPGDDAGEAAAKVPSFCVGCGAPFNNSPTSHEIVINNTNNIIANEDQLHFLFRDSTGALTSSPLLSITWNSGNQPDTISPGPDLSGDGFKCSFINGDTFFLYMIQRSAGNNSLQQLRATYSPVDGVLVTAKDTFMQAGQSAILVLDKVGPPIPFGANLSRIDPDDDAQFTFIQFDSGVPWTLTHESSANWLTITSATTGNPISSGQGGGAVGIKLAFTENMEALARYDTIRFRAVGRPDVFYFDIKVKQKGKCIPAQVNITTDPSQLCVDNNIVLHTDVGTDPTSGADLHPLYKYKWSEPTLIAVDSLKLGTLSPGTYSYSVTVTNTGCGAAATDNITITVSALPPIPTATSPTAVAICTDDNLPTFSVTSAGLPVYWYDVMSGGAPLLPNPSNSFTPTQYVNKTYYAESQSAGGCASPRRAFTLTVTTVPTLSISNKVCADNHQQYSFTITSNGTSLLVNNSPVSLIGGVYQSTGNLIGNTTTVKAIKDNCDVIVIVTPPVCPCDVNPPVFIQNYSICAGDPVMLSVGIVQQDVTVDWYDAATNGNKLNTVSGPAFMPMTPLLPVYYAQARSTINPCVSPSRTAVQLTEKPRPTLVLTDTVCTPDDTHYSISATTNGADLNAIPGLKSLSNGVYTFSGILAGQSVTLTALAANGCTLVQTVNAPNCQCIDLPKPVSGGNKTVCFGEAYPVLTVTVGQNQTANWYLGNVLKAIGTTSYTPNAPGTYLVEAHDTVENCYSPEREAVVLTKYAEIPLGLLPVSCSQDRSTYGFVVQTGNGKSLTVNNISITGNSGVFNVSGISVGTNAVVVVTDNSTLCERDTVLISPQCPCIQNIAQPGSTAANSLPVCQNEPKILTVTLDPDQTADWFNAQGSPVWTGASYPASTATPGAFTYTVEARDTVTDCSGAPISITFTINALPTLQVTSKDCENQNTYGLTVSTTNASTLTSMAGLVSGSNNSYAVGGIPINLSTTLTAINTQTGCAQPLTVAQPPSCDCDVLGTINQPASGGDQVVCYGLPNPALTAGVGANETVDWYDPSGAPLQANNTSYTPPNGLSPGVYTYFAETRNTQTQCTSDGRTSVKLTVNALPVLQILDTDCADDFVSYQLTGQTDVGNMVSASNGDASTIFGPGFFTVTGILLGVQTTVTVQNAAGCEASVTVLLSSCPCPVVNNAINNGDKVMCQNDPQAPVLSVSVSDPVKETADWYAANTGGIPIAINTTSFQPAAPASTTNYYAQARLKVGDCPSPSRTAVKLEVKIRPTAVAGDDQNICSGDTLPLSGVPGGGFANTFWISNGGGQFLPNNGGLTAQSYIPVITQGNVTLTLLSMPAAGSPCPTASDEMMLQVNPSPVLSLDSVYCSPDFQSYNVIFSSSTVLLNSSVNAITPIGNNQYKVNAIDANVDLQITALSPAVFCETTLKVSPPDPCPCPVLAKPVSLSGSNITVCSNIPFPVLTVTVGGGLKAIWYLQASGGIPFLSDALQYQPTVADTFYVEAIDPQTACPSERIAIVLNVKAAPQIFIGPDAELCPGKTVVLTADPGAGYTYFWANSSTAQSISVNQPATYLVTVSVNGCSAVDTFVVSALPALLTDIILIDTIDCFNGSGKIGVQPSNGTPPYLSYVWSNSSGLPETTVSAGIYSVTVTDSGGCTSTDVFTVGQPLQITISSQTIQGTQAGQATGEITVNMAGGTPPYNYQWQVQDSILNGQTLSTIDSLPFGNYFVAVTDANGCSFTSNALIIGLVATGNPSEANLVQLFPNPSTGRVALLFQLPETQNIEVCVLDVLGREIQRAKPTRLREGRIEFDLSSFASGLYWMKIRIGETMLVRSLSLNR